MLGQRRRRRINIKPALAHRLVAAGLSFFHIVLMNLIRDNCLPILSHGLINRSHLINFITTPYYYYLITVIGGRGVFNNIFTFYVSN